jgi:hypothetical protein
MMTAALAFRTMLRFLGGPFPIHVGFGFALGLTLDGLRLFTATLFRAEAVGDALRAVPVDEMLAFGILLMGLPFILGIKRLIPAPAAVWCDMIDEVADRLKLGKKQRLELYQTFFDELRKQMGTAINVDPKAAVAKALESVGSQAAPPDPAS